MALDAFVYCDCFEKNNLRCEPPGGLQIRVEPSGDLSCTAQDEHGWSTFLAWKRAKACLHHEMILLRHRLGTAAQIDQLRGELEKEPQSYPLLLKKVLYSGTHTCDYIPVVMIAQLAAEVQALTPEKATVAPADAVQLLKIRLAELVIAAQHSGKPICF